MKLGDRPKHKKSYNARLFSGGVRAYFHFARFRWIREEVRCLGIATKSVIELGCFDGRILDFLPKPVRYVGLDANWEGGLDAAREKYAGEPNYSFYAVETPSQIPPDLPRFCFGASLETLEHVPPELVNSYLTELAKRIDGYFVVTVPNEIGLVFLTKWLVKKIFRMSPKEFTVSELFYATIGRTENVRRVEHKGFDYRDMVREISGHFEIVKVKGFPMRFLPTCLCFGIGIVARTLPASQIEIARVTKKHDT